MRTTGDIEHELTQCRAELKAAIEREKRAEAKCEELKRLTTLVFNSARTNDDTAVGDYIVDSEALLDLKQAAITSSIAAEPQPEVGIPATVLPPSKESQ